MSRIVLIGNFRHGSGIWHGASATRYPSRAERLLARCVAACRKQMADGDHASSNASSKTGNDLAAHAGRFFKTTECNTVARYRRNRAPCANPLTTPSHIRG